MERLQSVAGARLLDVLFDNLPIVSRHFDLRIS
jgi:hypothetical protein